MPLPEGKLLCLDTTGNELMLALVEGGQFHFEHRAHSESHRYHSAMLIPLIQEALTQTGWRLSELAGLAVNIGPGSFTGIRTGITSVRLLGQFLSVPVYTFNTFGLLAAQTPGQTVAVYLDALRGRAYHAILRVEADGVRYEQEPVLLPLEGPSSPVADRVVASASLLSRLPEGTQTLEELATFTPTQMLALLQRAPDSFRQDWQSVLPLYLQEPNITQRKAKPGTMK